MSLDLLWKYRKIVSNKKLIESALILGELSSKLVFRRRKNSRHFTIFKTGRLLSQSLPMKSTSLTTNQNESKRKLNPCKTNSSLWTTQTRKESFAHLRNVWWEIQREISWTPSETSAPMTISRLISTTRHSNARLILQASCNRYSTKRMEEWKLRRTKLQTLR